MSPAGKHVIRRTSLEVTVSVKADAFRFQQEVVVWAYDHLLPQLDHIFASLPDTGEPIRIDRLEIELNSSDFRNWGNDVLGKLKSELVWALMNRIDSVKAATRDERVSHARSFLDKLAYYLETGVLPWSLAITSQSAFEEEMKDWLTSSGIGDLRSQVAELLQAEKVRSRFLASFSQAVLRETLTVFFAIPARVWENLSLDSEILRLAEPKLGNLFSRRGPLSIPIPEKVRENLSLDSETVRLEDLRSSFRQGPLSIPVMLVREFVDALAANSFVYTEQTEFEAVKSFLTRLVREKQIIAGDLDSIRFHSRSFQLAREAVLEPRSPSTARSGLAPPTSTDALASADDREKSKRQTPAVEGIFIQNAGLILLAPFLPMLLERVDLAKEGELKDPAMAMSLMHYLACGEEGPVEFQVVLPKVLCGWDIEKEIDLPDAVPQAMKEETRQLLESVIGHWAVLKDTSVEGLQEAFLRRTGKISMSTNNEWLLQVEQRAFDMLIQQLPWSFKVVKLSWMKRLLRTEWVD